MAIILIVDDSLQTRKHINTILTAEGYKVTEAVDGIEALEILPLLRPDLVVLDVVMPKMNGYEVCRIIKSHPNTKNITVLIITSLHGDNEIDHYWAIKQGADGFIPKPFQTEEFITIIKQLLINRQ